MPEEILKRWHDLFMCNKKIKCKVDTLLFQSIINRRGKFYVKNGMIPGCEDAKSGIRMKKKK